MILKFFIFLNTINFQIPNLQRLIKMQSERPNEKIIYQTHFDKEILENFNRQINTEISQFIIQNHIQAIQLTPDGGCDIDFVFNS